MKSTYRYSQGENGAMETRHQQRKHVFLYLDVINLDTDSLLGHLGDISKDGMMIIAGHPLPLYQVYKVRIKLPETGEFTVPFVDLRVETRWSRPDVNPSVHCTGCLFVKINPADMPIIEQIGEMLSFNA